MLMSLVMFGSVCETSPDLQTVYIAVILLHLLSFNHYNISYSCCFFLYVLLFCMVFNSTVTYCVEVKSSELYAGMWCNAIMQHVEQQ